MSMKKILILTLIAIFGATTVVLLFLGSSTEDTGFGIFQTYNDNGMNGGSNGDSVTEESTPPSFVQRDQLVYQASSMNTVLKSGQQIAVNNIMSADTVDPDNRQIFYFAENRNDADRPYDLVYFDEYDAFEIRLLQQPLDAARAQAELELMDVLGLQPEELCDLNLFVRTDISPYKGKELGVSFCRQAESL